MSRLAHICEPGMTYLITAVSQHRALVFADAPCAQAAHQDVAFYARKFKATSLAHVIMPDHIHWVILPSPEDYQRFAREQQERDGRQSTAQFPAHEQSVGEICHSER